MMERRQIVRLWRQGGDAAALVTLVRAEGSSYRRPGARLLLGGRGEYAGTISGGCLETEVVRKAAWLVREGAVVQRYSTMFDDTAEVPFGLGCGGVVDLLLEPGDTAECPALMEAIERSLAGEDVTVLTWLPREGRVLLRAVLSTDGDFLFASNGLTEPELAGARSGVLLGGRHRSSLLGSEVAVRLGRTVASCCEQIYAPVGLDLGGDGPEAIALAVIAEAQACCMGKLGASRRLSAEDVARHVSEGGVSRYLQS